VNPSMGNATDVLERLIRQMGDQAGPVEEVIGEWTGREVSVAATSVSEGAPRELAMSVVEELGETWGATGGGSLLSTGARGFMPTLAFEGTLATRLHRCE
jgi:hypothetical protein